MDFKPTKDLSLTKIFEVSEPATKENVGLPRFSFRTIAKHRKKHETNGVGNPAPGVHRDSLETLDLPRFSRFQSIRPIKALVSRRFSGIQGCC